MNVNKTYILENLGCANCAAKMERKIQELPEVRSASITFATKQLRIETTHEPIHDSEEHDAFMDGLKYTLEDICQSIERQVNIIDSDDLNNISITSSANKKTGFSSGHKTDVITLIISLVLFAAGAIIEAYEHSLMEAGGIFLLSLIVIPVILFLTAYILLGHKVLISAVRNIRHGQIFDENLLMAIATVAAFCIGEFAEGVGVMLFYRIGQLFEDIAVERSRSQIMDAVDMRPETVMLVKSHDEHDCGCGHEHHHEHHDCGCGHEHHHDHHDCTCRHEHHHESDEVSIIPASHAKPGDILLVRPGDRIPLDGVVLDGESRLDTSAVTGEPVPISVLPGDEVISGCINVSGALKIRVTKPLSESMVTRILNSVENAAAGKPKIDRFITRFARIYTPIVVGLAVLTAIIPSLITGNWYQWIKTAITFLVISCPCALVISVPLAFFSGIGAASKRGILFKGGSAIEALKNIKAIAMDKTGTITKGVFEVNSISTFGDLSEDEVLAIAAACESSSSHPIASSILARYNSSLEEHEHHDHFEALAIEEIAGMGIKAQLVGDLALCGNRKLMEKYDIGLSAISDITYDGHMDTEVLVATDGNLIGRIIISDRLKEDSISAISQLKAMGLTPAVLTGDNRQSANYIASKCGISKVFGQLLPDDKVSALKKLRSESGPVMFVGDGINDAPVLAGADVGAAMGAGADAAIEAADVVYMTSSLAAVPQSIEIAKHTGKIAMQNIIFALAVKLLVILLGFIGFANIWAAVFADTGVAMICILNSLRVLLKKCS